MALCVPKAMILGHSFVRRLRGDLERQFDDRTKRDFDLQDVKVRLFGVGGRTVDKIMQYDLVNVSRFAPDIVILEIGTNDLCNAPPETVGCQIDELVELLLNRFSVRVVGVCLVIKRAEAVFNEKIEMLNQYLSVVIDNPNAFVWRHKRLDARGHEFLLEDGVHLNPHGQYSLYRSYRGAVLKAVKMLNKSISCFFLKVYKCRLHYQHIYQSRCHITCILYNNYIIFQRE